MNSKKKKKKTITHNSHSPADGFETYKSQIIL